MFQLFDCFVLIIIIMCVHLILIVCCSGTCGVSVAVALADMHHCEGKMEAKRFKGIHGMPMRLLPQNNQQLRDQPISPYRLFM